MAYSVTDIAAQQIPDMNNGIGSFQNPYEGMAPPQKQLSTVMQAESGSYSMSQDAQQKFQNINNRQSKEYIKLQNAAAEAS